MSKPNRGRNIKKVANWRGTCPLCDRKRVKLLWPYTKDGDTINVCKICYAHQNKA